MSDLLPVLYLAVATATFFVALVLVRKVARLDVMTALASRVDALEQAQERAARAVKDELVQSRGELTAAAREQRQALSNSSKAVSDSVSQRMSEVTQAQNGQLDAPAARMDAFTKESSDRLNTVRIELSTAGKLLREEVVGTLTDIAETIRK